MYHRWPRTVRRQHGNYLISLSLELLSQPLAQAIAIAEQKPAALYLSGSRTGGIVRFQEGM